MDYTVIHRQRMNVSQMGIWYGGGWINAIYETSGTSPSYLGIFGDGPFRRMTWNNVWRDFDGCIDYAKENKSKYMGFQCGNQESGVAACRLVMISKKQLVLVTKQCHLQVNRGGNLLY